MNRNKWFVEWTGMNDLMNEPEWMINWIKSNEWFMAWTGISDSLNEQE